MRFLELSMYNGFKLIGGFSKLWKEKNTNLFSKRHLAKHSALPLG
jgi:hypothetical protein